MHPLEKRPSITIKEFKKRIKKYSHLYYEMHLGYPLIEWIKWFSDNEPIDEHYHLVGFYAFPSHFFMAKMMLIKI